MDLSALKTLGMAPGEIKVYEAILTTGLAGLSVIHEKTGMERRAIYDTLNKLIEKGFVTYTIEGGKKIYSCAPPGKLVEQTKKVKEALAQIEGLMPAIAEVYAAEKPAISLSVFRGIEGIKSVWEDMLNHKELRWIGSGNYVPKRMPAFFKHWNERRKGRKIVSYHLFRNEIRSEVIKDAGHARFLPAEFSGNPTVVCVYGNIVVNFLFGKELFAFSIESQELAENYRKYHAYLWEIADN